MSLRLACGFAVGLFVGAQRSVVWAAQEPTTNFSTSFSETPGAAKGASKGFKTWGVAWIDNWDTAAARGIGHQNAKIERHLLLVRHGQYENENAKNDDVKSLTPLGVDQAKRTGAFLKDMISHSPMVATRAIHAVYSSNLTRAKQTAEIILSELQEPNIKITIDPELRERFPCDPEPKYHKKAKRSSEEAIETTFHSYFHRPINEIPTTEIIVAHANVIRYFVMRALQLPPEAWLRFNLPHCSVTSLRIAANGHVRLGTYGSMGHLPGSMQTILNVA